MNSAAIPDEVRFARPAHVPGLELVSATYSGRSFPTHVHPEYVIGIVFQGAEKLSVRGGDHVVGRGSTLLIHPQEPHANAAIGDERLGYRVFYIPADLLGRLGQLPSFREPVLSSRRLYRRLSALHHALSTPGERLDQQSAFVSLAAELLQQDQPTGLPDTPPHAKLRQAKELIEAHYCDELCLDALADAAGLSPFHLLRSFKSQFGVSPIAYRNQLRVMEARRLIRSGEPLAEIAVQVGFVDQSHLTRQFQRVMGTTPGRYAQQ